MTGFLPVGDTFNQGRLSFSLNIPILGAGKTKGKVYVSFRWCHLFSSSMAQMPVDRHDHSCGLVTHPNRGSEIVVAGMDSLRT